MTPNASYNRNIAGKLLVLLFGIIFFAKAFADLSQVDNAYFIDLRNRIVGARLIEQDISPYFFKWDSSKPITLYDPFDRCNIKNNMITSPPSMLLLMQPLAHLSYTDISLWWIGIHYLFFLLIFIPIYARFKDPNSRMLILIVGCLLLFSEHWKDSVFKGQNYFVLPAVAAISLWLSATSLRWRYLIMGLLFAFLIWTRPNAALVVPFLFLCKEVQKKQLFAGLGFGAAFFLVLTLLLDHQSYWIDFYLTCKEWVRNNSAGLITYTCNKFVTVEDKVVIFPPGHPRVYWQTEIVNIYHFVWGIFHFLIPVIYLTIAYVLGYAAGLWHSFRGKANTFSRALLLGIVLYWFSEITAPILKVSYHYIELFPVVLLFAGVYKDLLLREKILLAASLVFTFLPIIPMNLGIAEFCTVACLCSWLFRRSFSNSTSLT